jgi:hypothetical protein
MADEVLEDFSDPDGKDLKRDQVYKYLRGGVRKIVAEIIKTLPDYNKNYVAKTLTSGSSALPDRFIGFFRVDVGASSDTAAQAEYVNEGKLLPGTSYSSADPKVFIRGNNFYVYPTDQQNAYLWYWEYPEVMTTESTEHGLPYGARDVLVNYALYKAWASKDIERAPTYKTIYKDSLTDYIDFVAQSRQKLTSGHIEVTSGSDLYDYD